MNGPQLLTPNFCRLLIMASYCLAMEVTTQESFGRALNEAGAFSFLRVPFCLLPHRLH
jgi:hypothetical protein